MYFNNISLFNFVFNPFNVHCHLLGGMAFEELPYERTVIAGCSLCHTLAPTQTHRLNSSILQKKFHSAPSLLLLFTQFQLSPGDIPCLTNDYCIVCLLLRSVAKIFTGTEISVPRKLLIQTSHRRRRWRRRRMKMLRGLCVTGPVLFAASAFSKHYCTASINRLVNVTYT